MYAKLERKFGKYAIRGLMKYVIILYIAGFIIMYAGQVKNVDIFGRYLSFNIPAILKGQVWRVFSWIMQPTNDDIFWAIISLWFYYSIGTSLERAWGTFRFNLFYFSGMFFNVLAAVMIYVITFFAFGKGLSFGISLEYINLSMFLAFAFVFAEARVLLYFIIPIKVKYLAYVYIGLEVINIISCYTVSFSIGIIMTILFVVSMLNFFIYYINAKNYGPGGIKQRARARQFEKAYNSGLNSAYTSQRSSTNVINNAPLARHRCAVCGRTELDDYNLEFRFCSKCDGNYEYCMEHLATHEHVKRDSGNFYDKEF